VPKEDIKTHRADIERFSTAVAGDEVLFHACSYRELLSTWIASPNDDVRAHAAAIATRFAP